jgi:hypothetical protein
MHAGSHTKNITRDEYVELVTSRRRIVRVESTLERVYELLDTETNERFRITEQDLHPAGSEAAAARGTASQFPAESEA